jgi:hypothetical protein
VKLGGAKNEVFVVADLTTDVMSVVIEGVWFSEPVVETVASTLDATCAVVIATDFSELEATTPLLSPLWQKGNNLLKEAAERLL